MAMTELDAVPGGMGLTGWLSETYAAEGFPVLGGAQGMVEGFRKVLPEGGRILVSEEAAEYRIEMEWLAAAMNAGGDESWVVQSAEEDTGAEGAVYRFFELFDWESIPAARTLAGRADVTPPFKPPWRCPCRKPLQRVNLCRPLRSRPLECKPSLL